MSVINAVDSTGTELTIGQLSSGEDVEVSADKYAELLKLDEILRELKIINLRSARG